MPSKKQLDYDSFDDDDDDDDDFKGLKPKSNVGQHTFDLDNGTCTHKHLVSGPTPRHYWQELIFQILFAQSQSQTLISSRLSVSIPLTISLVHGLSSSYSPALENAA